MLLTTAVTRSSFSRIKSNVILSSALGDKTKSLPLPDINSDPFRYTSMRFGSYPPSLKSTPDIVKGEPDPCDAVTSYTDLLRVPVDVADIVIAPFDADDITTPAPALINDVLSDSLVRDPDSPRVVVIDPVTVRSVPIIKGLAPYSVPDITVSPVINVVPPEDPPAEPSVPDSITVTSEPSRTVWLGVDVEFEPRMT